MVLPKTPEAATAIVSAGLLADPISTPASPRC